MILLVRHGESTWNAHSGLFRVIEAECDVDHRRVANLAGLWLRSASGRLVAGEAAP